MVLAPAIAVGWTRGYLSHNTSYTWWCLFSAVPLWFACRALYSTLQQQKYGTSICELERRPSATSGELRFTVHPEKAELSTGDATVDLRAEKRETTGTGKTRHTTVTVLWQQKQTVPVQGMGLGISASFAIPPDIPEAKSAFSDGIFWVLEVRHADPGINYAAIFDVALTRG